MRCRIRFALIALGFFAPVASAQPAAPHEAPAHQAPPYQPPVELLNIRANSASAWTSHGARVVQLQGNVSIQLDETLVTSENAVLWITDLAALDARPRQLVEIALLGNATVRQAGMTRLADRLLLDAAFVGQPRITADSFSTTDRSASQVYQLAAALHPASLPDAPAPEALPEAPSAMPPAPATTRPTRSMLIEAPGVGETILTDDGTVAIVYTGGILLMHWQPDGSLQTLRAERIVVFTSLKSDELRMPDPGALADSITAAYLEGDVQIAYTPPVASQQEQRLLAERAYYDFTTDRAILADAVLHATEPRRRLPIVIRAQTIRQLSQTDRGGEYLANNARMSTTAFRTPTYSIAANRVYVRRTPTQQERLGDRTTFSARHATLNLLGLPVFYLPLAGGSFTESAFPLRSLEVRESTDEGVSILTEWGLFETFGHPAPPGLDLSYRLDHFGERGPATGLNADYAGGFVTDPEKEPWNFRGEFTSYIIQDRGLDDPGRRRREIEPPRDLRGRALWAHQHILPDGWQVQLRAGYISDPTFLEQWFEDEFDNGPPHDLTLYVKQQQRQEAFTFLLNENPNRFVTTSESVEEQFIVERMPELGYHRLAESLAGDRFTFHSSNTVARLRMEQSEATLLEQAYRPRYQPGRPSIGQTGIYEDENWRGDFRQELNYPIALGQFRAVPYVFGRYIAYSESPDQGAQERLLAGAGMRLSIAFWKVHNNVRSELFDIHRIRHVVEPSLHLFTSAQTAERDEVFIYDESVDGVNDLSAMQVAVRQAWQTKRGGPGRWRSVDLVTLRVEGNFFGNKPREEELEPTGFRGLFYESLPEASIPRDSINADASWRISDSTILLGDIQHNLDETRLATASLGLAVTRAPRVTYYLGARYIEDLDSTLVSGGINYKLTPKYTLALGHSYDLREKDRVRSTATLIRRFQGFAVSIRGFHDAVNDNTGFSFRLIPDLAPANPSPRPLPAAF